MIDGMPTLDDLRELVRKDSRTRREIARAAGIHETTFSTFMAGRRGLDIDTAEKLAIALGAKIQVVVRPPKRK